MTTLNAKQRLRSTLEGSVVDRPPFICPGGMMNMAVTEVMHAVGHSWPKAHVDADSMASLVLGMADLAGVENLGAPFCMTIEAEALGAQVDMGNAETEPRVIAYALDTFGDIDRLMSFDPSTGRAAVAAQATELLVRERPDLPMIASLTGPISLATSLVDPLMFYRAMRRDKQAAHALLGVSADAAIALGDALVAAGADTICIADPSGTGELIGRSAFEEFALPYLNRIVEHFAQQDVPSVVHICGDVSSLGEVLGKLSAPCISIDSNVSFRTLRRLAPQHAGMGNISTYLLEYGKAETIRQVTSSRIASGVEIIAPACGIGPRTPLANIRAIADIVRESRTLTAADSQLRSA